MIIFLIDRKFTHDTLSIHVIFPILMNCFDPLQFSLEKMCHIRVLGIIVFSTFFLRYQGYMILLFHL